MAAMPIRTSKWPAGAPCWVDLTVSDVPAAQAFYGQVLGWSWSETADDFGGYVIGRVGGAAAAGIGPTPQPGLPSAWTLYLADDDAATCRIWNEFMTSAARTADLVIDTEKVRLDRAAELVIGAVDRTRTTVE